MANLRQPRINLKNEEILDLWRDYQFINSTILSNYTSISRTTATKAIKYILDRLQVGGYLKNDNNKYISGFVDRFIYDGQQKVVITILENDTEDE